jgi:hypothetical protein
MNGTPAASYAYVCVRARTPNARGDEVVDALSFAPDELKRRGTANDAAEPWKHTQALYLTPRVQIDGLESAIEALVERLRSHTAELRDARDRLRIWMAVVADPLEGPWGIRLSCDAIAWLASIRAALWIDTFSVAPDGTEDGRVCGLCGLRRPTVHDEALVDLLNGWGPYHGIADARLVAAWLDHGASMRIAKRWKYLYASLDEIGVQVLAGRPWATKPKRDGAVAVRVLLDRLRANRSVRRALRSGNAVAIELRVRHWANVPRAGAWLTRRDIRDLAKLGAAFVYHIVPDRKPSFAEDGTCNHCAYVQSWRHAEEPDAEATNADRRDGAHPIG